MYKTFSFAGRQYRLNTEKARVAFGRLIGAAGWAAVWALVWAAIFSRVAGVC